MWRSRGVWCLLCLLVQGWLGAQSKVDFMSPEEGIYMVDYHCSTYPVQEVDADYCQFAVEGLDNDHHQPGMLALPTTARIVALPVGSTLQVQHIEVQTTVIQLPNPLRCASPASLKQPVIAPRTETKVAEVDTHFLRIEPLGQMADRQLFRVVIAPVHPTDDGLQYVAATTIRATLRSTIAEVIATPHRERYVIATRPLFAEGLQPFVQWKRQTGYDVVMVVSNSNKRDTIKQLLSPYFANPAQLPTYLLLVGDVAQIQSYAGTTCPQGLSMHNTDLYYADFSGDYLPEVQMGRWPVNDTAELRAVVQKTLEYEQLQLVDTAYLRRALFVAGRETQSPAPTTTNGQVNYLKSRIVSAIPTMDTHCFYNPASANQREAIQSVVRGGVGLVNYTGHGSVSGWSSPSVGFRALDSLEAVYPAVYINNCCNSSDFVGSCFGEQLLRKPHGGAVGVIGATNETLWNEDYYWAVGPKYPFSTQPVFDSLYPGSLEQMFGSHPSITTMGQLVQAGNLAVSQSGSPYDKFYWEIYTLFGDPSLMPWIGQPSPSVMAVEQADLAQGSTRLRLSGTPYCRVALVQADSLLGAAETDAQGLAVLHLSQPLDTLPLLLTTTGFGIIPKVDTLQVFSRLPYPLLFHDIVHHNDTLVVGLLNSGSTAYSNVRVAMGCSSLLYDTLTLAVLPSPSDTLLAFAVHVDAPTECLLLALDAEGDTVAMQWVQLEPARTDATIRFHLYTASGEVARSVEATQCYRFEADPPTGYTLVAATATVDDAAPVEAAGAVDFCIPNTVRHVRLHATAIGPDGVLQLTKWVVGGHAMDGFEEGFESYPWQHSSLRAWQVEEGHPDGGVRNARSAPIDYRQTSNLGLTLLLMAPDSISFRASTSSEANYDKLQFSINDSNVLTLSGERSYQRYTYPLREGVSHLRWRYVKDETTDVGDDCARIDNVRLPLALWDSTYGYFGSATSLGVQVVSRLSCAPYPNPTTGVVTVEVSAPTTLWVYTAEGQPVGVHRLGHAGTHTLCVATRPGVYLLRCDGGVYKVIVTNIQR